MNKIFSILVVVTFLLSNTVQAEGKPLKEKLSKGSLTISAEVKGCEIDEKVFCPGLKSGSKKAFMCLMAYEAKLSKQCVMGFHEAAMVMKNTAAMIDYSLQSCEADADKHCLNIQPGNGQIVACLKKNESKVSKQCVGALKETGLWGMKPSKK